MKWLIYYGITVILNIVCAIVFHEHLNITAGSIVPLALIALSIFQAVYFHNYRSKKDFNTYNDSELTEEEWAQLSVYMSKSYLIGIPWFLPFVLFFSTGIKMLSLLVFFAAFTGGAIYYRIRHSKDLQSRFAKEADELEEQKKRESLGKWK